MSEENKLEGGVSFDTTDAKANITELNRAIKVLDSGFKASAASLGDWTKTTEGNESRMKSLADIMDLQRQKITNLTKQYEAVAQKEGAASKAAQDLEIKINREREALGKNEVAARECAARLDQLGDEAGGAADDIEDVGDAADEAAEKTSLLRTAVGKLGAGLKTGITATAKAAAAALAAVGTAAVAATKSAFDMAVAAGEFADELLTTSAQTGISAKRLQEWDYAARFIDTDVSTMTSSMAKMVKQMGMAATGSKASAANFKRLGVDIYDSNGKLRDSEAVFADAIDALGKIGSESERDAKAMMIFGKSAQELNPLIKAGGDQLRALGQEAQQMGVVMSDSALDAMGAFDDSMQRAQAAAGGMKNAIATNVIPAFQPLVETATSAMSKVTRALVDGIQPGEIQKLVGEIMGILSSVTKRLTGMLAEALPVIMQAISAIINGIVQTLPQLLNQLLPAAMNLLQSLLNAVMQNLDPLINFAVKLIMQLANFLIKNIPTLIQAASKILLGLVDGLIQNIPQLVPAAIQMIVQLAVGLVQAIPQLMARLPEIVAAIIKGLTAVDWPQVGLQLIQGLIDGLAGALKALWGGIQSVFQNLWDGIKGFFGIHSPSRLAADAGGQIMAGLVGGIADAAPGAEKQVQGAFGDVWDAAEQGIGTDGSRPDSQQAGAAVIGGLADGIVGGQRAAVAKARSTAQAILVVVRSTLGVSGSVSSVFLGIGKALAQGIANGILSGVATIRAAARRAAQSAIDAAKSELGIASPSKVAEDMIGKQWGAGVASGITNSISKINTAINTISTGMQAMTARQSAPALALAGAAPAIDSVAIGREIARELAASGVLNGSVVLENGEKIGRWIAPTVSRVLGATYTTMKRSGYRG